MAALPTRSADSSSPRQTANAFDLDLLSSVSFAIRNTFPRMSAWSAFPALKMGSAMLAEGRSGLVLGLRYPTGFPVDVYSPWREVDVSVNTLVAASFRFAGGGAKTLRESGPVFVERGPDDYSIKLVSGISGPSTTVDVELRDGEVVVVDIHPATSSPFGRRGPRIDAWLGVDDLLATSGVTPDWSA